MENIAKRKGFEYEDPEAAAKRFRAEDATATVEADYYVEQRLVGWIIGRGGNTLKEIEMSYQVKVVLDQAYKELGYSQLRIAGTQIMVTQAADHINMSLARAVATSDGGEPVGPFLLDQPPSVTADHMYEDMKIEQRFVGWLLGRSGGVIREIEQQSSCRISINQDSRAQGYSRAQLHGNIDQRLHAKQLIGESIAKAMESPAGGASGHGLSAAEEDVQVEQKWIGWLLGRQGGVIKEIETEFGVRISIDQSTKSMGYSTVKISGNDPTPVAFARDRIQGQLQKVGGTSLNSMTSSDGGIAAGWDNQLGQEAGSTGFDNMAGLTGMGGPTGFDQMGGQNVFDPSMGGPTAFDNMGQAIGNNYDLHIEQKWIGWLLGRGGGVMKEIETASGAKVSINQDTKHLGYSVAQMTGHPSAVAMAKGMIEEKLLQVNPSGDGFGNQGGQAAPASMYAPLQAPQAAARAPATGFGMAGPPASAGPMEGEEAIDLQLEQKWVGWILGKSGATLREIEAQAGARISIDQTNKHLGHSIVKIVGSAGAVLKAQQRIQASLAMAAGGAEKPTLGLAVGGPASQQGFSSPAAPATGVPNVAGVPGVIGMSSPSAGFAANGGGDMQVEQRMVGWILGTRGAVLKEIETNSGTRISMDQSTKELGYSTARIVGPDQGIAIARQLIGEKIGQAHPAGPPGSGPQVAAGVQGQFGSPGTGNIYDGQAAAAALLQGFLQ